MPHKRKGTPASKALVDPKVEPLTFEQTVTVEQAWNTARKCAGMFFRAQVATGKAKGLTFEVDQIIGGGILVSITPDGSKDYRDYHISLNTLIQAALRSDAAYLASLAPTPKG